jgi:hypothetical protein
LIEAQLRIKTSARAAVFTVHFRLVIGAVPRHVQHLRATWVSAWSGRASRHLNRLSRNKRQLEKLTWLHLDSERQCSTSNQHKEKPMKSSQSIDQLFNRIANEHLYIETLETQHRDRLDFHEVAVWGIKRALAAAYAEGLAEGKKEKASRSQTCN